MSKEASKSYYPALDSIRLLAMLAILIYHYAPHRLLGGFIGVDLFLVISGFLLAKSLMKWDYKGFASKYASHLLKRVLRLGVPLVVVFLLSVSIINLFFSDLLHNIRGSLISSLLYVNNWWQIGLGYSYFEQYVNPSAFTHLWYVAVLMQLSVIWPLLILFLRRLGLSPRAIALAQCVLAMASAIEMAVLYQVGGDPSRVYYGTDTRLYAFALGGALGSVWHPGKLVKRSGRVVSLLADVVAIVALAALVYCALTLQDQATFTYRGGMAIAALLSTVLVAALTVPNGILSRALSFNGFVYLGKCTYSTYLWYYPILTAGAINGFLGANKWIQWILLFVLSVLTYELVEKRFVSKVTKGELAARDMLETVLRAVFYSKKGLVAFIIVVALAISTSFGFVRATSGANETVNEMQAMIAQNELLLAKQQALQEALAKRNAQAEIQDIPFLDRSVMLYCHDLRVTFIGDSVLLGAAAPLTQAFPMSFIDGKVGRHLIQGPEVVKAAEAQGKMYDIVVISLGSNGPFTDDQFTALMDLLGDKEVFLVNTYVPRDWQDSVNTMLSNYAAESKKDNIHLIDWYGFISQRTDLLYEDFIHPLPEGAEQFTKLIADAIYDEMASDEQKERDKLADQAAASANAQASAPQLETPEENTKAE